MQTQQILSRSILTASAAVLCAFTIPTASAATLSFEVSFFGADPLNGTAWGYRNDLQTGPQPFSLTADFVPTILAGAGSPPGVGYVPVTAGEGALVINGNSAGGMRTATMSNFTGLTDGISLVQTAATAGISLASSIGNIDYRWQKLTANNSAAMNAKFQLWGLNGIGVAPTFLGSAVYDSVLDTSSVGDWITETDIQNQFGWFPTQNTIARGGYDQTLSALLANIASDAGRPLSSIVASDVHVGIGSSGSGGSSISGAVDWISFDVGGGAYGATYSTIATNFVPEPGTIGLLLVGAVGMLNRRRRQA